MDRIGKMTAFVRVVETGSFVGAAGQLRLSSTAVSKHVRELEERLGVRLLHRTTRRVSLTEVGALFYKRCSELLVELDELENAASQLQTTPRGVLRISAPLAFGSVRISAVLADFSRLYPEVTVELILADRLVDVVEEGFDLAVMMGDMPNSSYMTRLLCVAKTIVCGAPSYLAQRGTPQTPDDLIGHNCLGHAFLGLSAGWMFTDANHKQHVIKISGNFRTNSAIAQLTAALQGQGLTLQPSYLVADSLNNGSLVALLEDYTAPEIPIRLVYPPGRHISAKVRTFIDFLVSRFAIFSVEDG